MFKRVRYAQYALFAALPLLLWSPSLPAQPESTPQERIRQILNKKENSKTRFALHFIDLESSRTIFAHRSDAAQIPASNMKLITTAGAVDILGADFAYETKFALNNGNLIIIASGDPLLGDPVMAREKGHDIDLVFNQLLAQLKNRKITTISGDLLIDDFLFDDERFHPSWPVKQSNRWFTAQVSALIFNDNCVDVTISPTKIGKTARFSLKPNTTYVNITNKCTTADKGTNTCWAAREIGTNNITLRSAVRYEDIVPVTVERPSAFFGHVLAEYLLAHGVSINGKLIIKKFRQEQDNQAVTYDRLYTYRTPINDVLIRANRDSLGLAAECLFKTIGAHLHPQPGTTRQGSWQRGREAVSSFLKKLGVDPNHYKIDDGSGLSRQNRLSPRVLTAVLAYMYRHEGAEMFRKSLATPKMGTLKKNSRFRESTYYGRIFAKSGYISGVWALSGYCRTSDGRWLAFSILAEKAPASPLRTIDQIVKEFIK